jgi:hypothetical protein
MEEITSYEGLSVGDRIRYCAGIGGHGEKNMTGIVEGFRKAQVAKGMFVLIRPENSNRVRDCKAFDVVEKVADGLSALSRYAEAHGRALGTMANAIAMINAGDSREFIVNYLTDAIKRCEVD